jgi:hypothetical protein
VSPGGKGKARLTRSRPGSDTWEQSGSAFEFYAGGQFVSGKTADNGFLIVIRAGYVVADYGTVEGSSPGDPSQLDMSGWFLDVAIGGLLVTRSNN